MGILELKNTGQEQWLIPIVPASWRWRLEGLQFNQPRQKISKTSTQSISWAWWHEAVIPDTQKAVGRRH
jgi:hypothetical protein